MAILVKIQKENINLDELMCKAEALSADTGAQVVFTGFVRRNDYLDPISHLYIDHYPTVTESEIYRIIAIAQQRWAIANVMVIHRVEKINVGEAIVSVMTQAKRRIDAYAANEFIMDYLKIAAPFWKKECFENQKEKWVEAKLSDQTKFKTWSVSP